MVFFKVDGTDHFLAQKHNDRKQNVPVKKKEKKMPWFAKTNKKNKQIKGSSLFSLKTKSVAKHIFKHKSL